MSFNAKFVQRRNHKERAQPTERERLGLLEKKKDYSLRAKDFNEKKKRIRALRQKAQERNPDEFHFAMMSARTHDGVRIADRGNKALNQDVVKLLKTQDVAYLRTMLQQTRREIAKVEEEFQLESEAGGSIIRLQDRIVDQGTRVAFVDSLDQQRHYNPKDRSAPDGEVIQPPGTLTYATPFPSTNHVDGFVGRDRATFQSREYTGTRAYPVAESERKRKKRSWDAHVSRIAKLREQESGLAQALQEGEAQRDRMSNSAGGVNKSGVSFRARERKS